MEPREHLPFEYAALGFLTGWGWVVAVCAALFILAWIRETLRPPKDHRDGTPGGRPFMTPALRKSLKYFPFEE